MKENEFDEEEYKRIIAEYKQSIRDDIYDEEDFRTLETGIKALDITFSFDSRVEELEKPFLDAIAFMKNNTDLSQDEILKRINSKISTIELVDHYEEKPSGVGYVDNIFHLLSVNIKRLKSEPEVVCDFIRHEMTHMLSGEIVKKGWHRRPILISGYSKEDVFDFSKEEPPKENENFNEAVVEMFVYQNEAYRTENAYGFNIYTNQDFNEGYYCINSNLIRQMMLARGINQKTLFQGLYNKKTAHKVEKKFNRKLFQKLSANMDDIADGILDYCRLDDLIEEDKENRNLCRESEQTKLAIVDKIKESEKIIIDHILVPRLKRLSPEKRESLLAEYIQYVICEKDYFKQRTHYQAVSSSNKNRNQNAKPWIQKVNINRTTELRNIPLKNSLDDSTRNDEREEK